MGSSRKSLNFTPEEEATIQIEMNKIQSTINTRKLKKEVY